MEHGADLSQTLGNQGTPLHWAVFRGRSASIIELLLKYGAPFNEVRQDGKTAYMLAVRFGQIELAVILRNHGAVTDVSMTDRLFGAFAASNESAVLGILNDEPSLLSNLSDQDKMMLFEFAEMNNANAVNLMLNTGFDNSIKKDVGTALHVAAWFGHIETVRILLTHGASVTSRNTYGGTSLDSAVHGSIHCLSTPKGAYTEVVEALIHAGAAIPEITAGSKEINYVLSKYNV